jgi:hypothetical protein
MVFVKTAAQIKTHAEACFCDEPGAVLPLGFYNHISPYVLDRLHVI